MSYSLPKVIHTYQNHSLDSMRWNRYTPRGDDIIVATSYKSGTTWVLGIVRQLIFLGQEAPPYKEFWLDAAVPPLDKVIGELEAQQHRRYIKTHLPLDGLPFHSQVKYIVVGRDGRDVFMSLWNTYSHLTPALYSVKNGNPDRCGDPFPICPPDIHQCWRNWITRGWFPWESEGYPYWGNLHHTQTWWPYRNLDNILFVHYNDLLADLGGEVRRIARFLQIELPVDGLPAILQAVSLDSMRHEAEIDHPGMEQTWQGGAKTFFFRGTNGRWKNVLSAVELALYEEAVTRVLTPDCARWLEQGRVALV